MIDFFWHPDMRIFYFGVVVGVLVAYLWYKHKIKKFREMERTNVLDHEMLHGDHGDCYRFCKTLGKRLEQVYFEVKGHDFRVAADAVNYLRDQCEYDYETSLKKIFKAAAACRIYIFWVEDRYEHVVRKALREAGALSLVIIATIAYAAMVALFIVLTLPMLGIAKIMPSTGTTCKQAIESLRIVLL